MGKWGKNALFSPKVRTSDQKQTRESINRKNHWISLCKDLKVGKASSPMVGRSVSRVPSIINPTYLFLGSNPQQFAKPTVGRFESVIKID